MKDRDWQNVFGRAPAEFIDQVDEALNRLEEEREMKRRYRMSAVLIAAVIVLLTAGAAVAAGMGMLGKVNGVNEMQTLPGAEAMVRKNLGRFDLPAYDVIVEEAVHDGQTLFVQMRLIPDSADHAPFNVEYPEPDKDKGIILYEESGTAEWNVTGRADGKQVLFYDLRPGGASGYEIQYLDVENNADGSVSIWFEGYADEEITKEEVRLNFGCRWGLLGDFDPETMRGRTTEKAVWLPENEEIRFEVGKGTVRTQARLEAAGESEKGEMTFYSGSMEITPLRGYFTIRYYCMPDREIVFFDAEGRLIESRRTGYRADIENDVPYREITGEMQALDPLPETIYAAILDGDGEVLDRIECRVIEEKAE